MADNIADFVDQTIADSDQPVVIFALEWCEFCWSVRKFFKQLGLDYGAVELDSVALQEGSRGRLVRDELEKRTGMTTIPQIFIAGEFVGGCTDVFDRWKDGTIQPLLRKAGVSCDFESSADPYSFLPDWLHPR